MKPKRKRRKKKIDLNLVTKILLSGFEQTFDQISFFLSLSLSFCILKNPKKEREKVRRILSSDSSIIQSEDPYRDDERKRQTISYLSTSCH